MIWLTRLAVIITALWINASIWFPVYMLDDTGVSVWRWPIALALVLFTSWLVWRSRISGIANLLLILCGAWVIFINLVPVELRWSSYYFMMAGLGGLIFTAWAVWAVLTGKPGTKEERDGVE